MYRRLLFLILPLYSFQVFSQDIYPGFIISLGNDTIRGQLIQDSFNANFSYCQFKTTDHPLKQLLEAVPEHVELQNT